MTLISNIIHNDFIIIASDKRRTVIKSKNEQYSVDDENKLLLGSNYAIGVQGSLSTKNEKYLIGLRNFVEVNKIISPEEVIPIIINLFPNISNDENCSELNLTFSGFYDGNLFSYYLKLKTNEVINCVETDNFSIRFNNENNIYNDILVRRSLLFIKRYLYEKNLYNKIALPNITEFDREIVINALKFMYHKFHLNDEEFYTIGGEMEYCIFSNDAIIDTNI
jgi:hypothetical protein